ncbi:hypothetical protein GCM10011594_41730 [Nakamurella endophytica]|uniref:Uncharacterized protein n=1 Tax=Nakamurella endophytica TaxID=1748367 RepID=A0A917WNK8_9ACTN|nr:hypothetical protein GCM10011594_41730 [Nakamurella endophytica]
MATIEVCPVARLSHSDVGSVLTVVDIEGSDVVAVAATDGAVSEAVGSGNTVDSRLAASVLAWLAGAGPARPVHPARSKPAAIAHARTLTTTKTERTRQGSRDEDPQSCE